MTDRRIEQSTAALQRCLQKTVGMGKVDELHAATTVLAHLSRALISLGAVEKAAGNVSRLGEVTFNLGQRGLYVSEWTVPRRQPKPDSGTLVAMVGSLAGGLEAVISATASTASHEDRRLLIWDTLETLDQVLDMILERTSNSVLRPQSRMVRGWVQEMRDWGLEVQGIAHDILTLVWDAEEVVAQAAAPRPADAAGDAPEAEPSEAVTPLPEAMAQLCAAASGDRALTAHALLSAAVAGELVARRGEAELEQHGIAEHGRSADAWLAVQAALAVVHDQPAAGRAPDSAVAEAALAVGRAAPVAGPSDLARAVQDLPLVVGLLAAGMRGWPDATLSRSTSPLPGTGYSTASLEQGVARVNGAVRAASFGSVILAVEMARREPDAVVLPGQSVLAAMGEFRRAARLGEAAVQKLLAPRPDRAAAAEGPAAVDGPAASPGGPGATDAQPAGPRLPPGYRLDENAGEGSATRYEVMRVTDGWAQFVGLRTSRADGARAAWQHLGRRHPQESNPPPGTHPSGRSGPSRGAGPGR